MQRQFYETHKLSLPIFRAHAVELIPGFDLHWIMEGKANVKLIIIGNRYFDIHQALFARARLNTSLFAALYWYERTNEINLRTILDDSQQVVGEIIRGNYEVGKAGTETSERQ